MPSSVQLRHQIESALATRMPGALSPVVRRITERTPCTIDSINDLLGGGLPLGAISEFVGSGCSGRTSLALSFLSTLSNAGQVAAWVDVSDSLDPESAAAFGVDLQRLLWIRCRASNTSLSPSESSLPPGPHQQIATQTSLPVRGGRNHHPRSEATNLPHAIQSLLGSQPRSSAIKSPRSDRSIASSGAPSQPLAWRSPHRQEQVPSDRLPSRRSKSTNAAPSPHLQTPLPSYTALPSSPHASRPKAKLWTALDQALRTTDLLLQNGGFGCIVLDLASTPAEFAWRIPVATWFRYRAACERARTSLLLLTQHPCARSSAELVMRMQPGQLEVDGNVLHGIAYRAELDRQRFAPSVDKVVSIRKPPQPVRPGAWTGRSSWATSQ